MTPSFSPYWDRLVRRAIRERRTDLLRDGRSIEITVMGLVQFPDRIQQYLDAGRFSDLAYLAEYIRAGVPAQLKRTDPVLYRNLSRGMREIHRRGWHQKLKPGPLRTRAFWAKKRAEG